MAIGIGIGIPFKKTLAGIPFKSDLLFDYDGQIVEKSDGFYFKDQKNSNDGKIINNRASRFSVDGAYVVLTPLASLLSPSVNKINIYEFYGRFPNLTQSTIKYIYSGGGTYNGEKGLSIGLINDKLQLSISNGVLFQVIASTTSIPDNTNFHKILITVNLINKTVTFSIDGVSDTKNITLSGGTYDFASTTLIGRYALSCNMDLIYYKISIDSVIKLFMSLKGEGGNESMFNLVDGYELTSSARNISIVTQDVYPYNVIHGFQLYKKTTDSSLRYVSPLLNGQFFTPTLTGYTKIGDYPAGNGFNYSEASIYVNESITLTATSILTFPFTNIVAKTTGLLISRILYYNRTLPLTDLSKVLNYLGYSFERSIINCGDSIACGGGYPLVSELPEYLLPDQPKAKIYDLASASVQTLTKDNSDQIAYTGSFSPLLAFAKNYDNNIWLMGKAVGGSTLYNGWKTTPEATYLTDLKNSVRNTFPEMLKILKYPSFEIYCSLGHNDAGLGGDAVTNFGANLELLIGNIRSFINQTAEFHIIRPRKLSENRISVASQIDSIASLENKIYAYDPEDITSYEADTVHPDTTGSIQLGILFESKQYDKP